MNKNQMTEFSFEKETNLFVPQYLHFDAEYFCNPNVFTFLFNKRHLYNSVSRGCFSVSLNKMRIINKENKCVTHVQMHFP